MLKGRLMCSCKLLKNLRGSDYIVYWENLEHRPATLEVHSVSLPRYVIFGLIAYILKS